jgi:hypothetical protein
MSAHWWLARFAIRWLQLVPDAGAHKAMRCAVANYHRAVHLPPCAAAEIYHKETRRRGARDASVTSPAIHAMSAGHR